MNILMIVESNFPRDIRVRQESYLLNEHGHKVSVIAIKDRKQKYYETINEINVYRIPKIEIFKYGKHFKLTKLPLLKRSSNFLKAIVGYGLEYVYFTTACLLLSFLVVLKDKFDVIHTHNPPDTLFVITLFYKMFGKKFVFDHHDLSPDLFVEKYGDKYNLIYNLLLFFEKISCRSADVVIATNESYKNIEIKRCGVKPENIFVVRNGPDLNEIKMSEPIDRIKTKGKIVLCYLGAINIQDGVNYLLTTLSQLIHKQRVKAVLLLIIGDGDYLNNIKIMAKEMELEQHIIFTGHIAEKKELNRYLSTADIFVDAAPYSFLNNHSTFIKHMEYMVFEKPIVSFALKESIYSLKDAGIFISPNDTDAMARRIIELINDDQMREQLGQNARKRVRELSWDKVSLPLLEAYKKLEL